MNFKRNIAILQFIMTTPLLCIVYTLLTIIYGPDIIIFIVTSWININFWLVENEYLYGVTYCINSTLDSSLCTVENMVWTWCKMEILILLAIIIITPIIIIIWILCMFTIDNTIKQINEDIAKYDAQALS